MILTLFSFGLNWAIFAFTFVIMARILPGFHSSYIQSTFLVGFIVGLLNAIIIKATRVMAFEVPVGLLYFIILLADFLLIMATNQQFIGYYLTGRKSPFIASVVLAIIAFVTEFVKEKFRADAR